jgi:hypothetical protein
VVFPDPELPMMAIFLMSFVWYTFMIGVFINVFEVAKLKRLCFVQKMQNRILKKAVAS